MASLDGRLMQTEENWIPAMTSDASSISETIAAWNEREKRDKAIGPPAAPPAEPEVKTEPEAPSAESRPVAAEAEGGPKEASDAAPSGEAKTDSVAGETGQDAAVGQGATPSLAVASSGPEAAPGAALSDAEAALERRDYATAKRLFQTIGRTDAAEAIGTALAALDRKDYAAARELFEALAPLKGSAAAEGAKAPASRGEDLEKPAPPPLEVVPIVEPDDRRPPLLAERAKPRGRKPLMFAAGLALLAVLGAAAMYARQSGRTIAVAGGEAPAALASGGDLVKPPPKPDTGSAASEDGRSKTDDLSAALAQVTSRLDRIETTYGARLDQLGQRSDPNASARLADLSARLDALEKKAAAPAPNSGEVSELGAKLEKLEKKVAAATPSAKEVSDLTTRLDKLEKRTAAALDGPAKPEAEAGSKHATSVAKAQPPGPNGDQRPGAARPVMREYSVSDVQDGFAVIESRYGSQEVAPGDFIPGAGRVLRIERRGGEWYVLTSNGVIGRGSGTYPSP